MPEIRRQGRYIFPGWASLDHEAWLRYVEAASMGQVYLTVRKTLQ